MKQTEAVLADGVQGRGGFEVTIRYTAAAASINTGDRMVDDRSGRSFAVKGPPLNLDEKRKYLQLVVESGGPDG